MSKKNILFLLLLIVSLVFFIDDANASGICQCMTEMFGDHKCGTGCISVGDNPSSCVIGEDYDIGVSLCSMKDSCSDLTTICKNDACPTSGGEDGAECFVHKGYSLWGFHKCRDYQGKWSASSSECVQCNGKVKTHKFADAGGLYVDKDGNVLDSGDITDKCESACGADNDCDEKTPGTGGCDASCKVCDTVTEPTGLTPSGTVYPGEYTLLWNRVSGASKYAVRVNDLTDPALTCNANGDICDDHVLTKFYSSYTFMKGRSYSWWVHAINNCNEWSDHGWANVNLEVTPSPPSEPEANVNLEVTPSPPSEPEANVNVGVTPSPPSEPTMNSDPKIVSVVECYENNEDMGDGNWRSNHCEIHTEGLLEGLKGRCHKDEKTPSNNRCEYPDCENNKYCVSDYCCGSTADPGPEYIPRCFITGSTNEPEENFLCVTDVIRLPPYTDFLSGGWGVTYGRITDKNTGAPVSGVIAVAFETTPYHHYGGPGSNEDGAYWVFSPPGIFKVITFKPDWAPADLETTVRGGQKTRLDIGLDRDLNIGPEIPDWLDDSGYDEEVW